MPALKEMGAALMLSGIVAGLSAWFAWVTGDDIVLANGSSWHTHTDATWVLAVLGVLLLANGGYMMSLGTPGSWVDRKAS